MFVREDFIQKGKKKHMESSIYTPPSPMYRNFHMVLFLNEVFPKERSSVHVAYMKIFGLKSKTTQW